MKRPGTPRRSSRLPRGGRPIPRTPITRHARPASETVRIYGTPEHRAWMKRQPCVICGRIPSDAAHVVSGGTGRKADASSCAPLCADDVRCGYSGHHSEYDAGKRSFRAKYGVDLAACAAATARAWEASQCA